MKQEGLLAQIAAEETRLAELEKEGAASRTRLEALREQLADGRPAPTASLPLFLAPGVPVTPAEKVLLFRSLFRGREDVFPIRFLSRKTGKAGYAPACNHKFLRGVCGLPRVKCGDCSNQAFLPVGDRAILDHLRGRHVLGVYPLLLDETCWFLAVDLDNDGWKEDAAAFVETCRSADVPVALERSRSGNGAHAWIFFTAPVPVSMARNMGSYLLTETMARRHELRMQSYDRLFPNQDTMPRGGFGNLIALPLQYEPRQRGNTVFVDDGFHTHPDQWAFLASICRIHPDRVEAIAREAARRGRIVGVRLAEPDDETAAAPWTRPPSGRQPTARVPGPLPATVRAVLAQRLFVRKAGLPSPMISQIKRLAAFQNPEFYKKQRLRLSTALTPRVIACAEDCPQHVSLPRGCLDALEALLHEHGVALSIDDQRVDGEAAEFRFRGELTAAQQQTAQEILQHDNGVLVAPPGAGKTVLGTYLIAARRRSTLVLVHRRPLLDQWVTQLSAFLGVSEKEVGQIGGGRRTANGRLDVAMIQSLVRGGSVDDIVASYGHVIVDECHHIPAVSFERVLSQVKARYNLGLTATPHRRDGHHPILEMQLGPFRSSATARSGLAQSALSRRLFVRPTAFRLHDLAAEAGIQMIYRTLAADEARNQLIVDDVLHALDNGRSPILLTERRDHLESLAERLEGKVPDLLVLRGGMKPAERRALSVDMAGPSGGRPRLVIATGRYIGEGFDDARLDTLFLAMPISWKGTLVQYAGRLHRLRPGKQEIRIYDYVDQQVPVLLRMFEKRLRAYRSIGYSPIA